MSAEEGVAPPMLKPDVTQYSLMSHVQKSNSLHMMDMGPPSSAPFNPLEEFDKDRLKHVAEIRKRKKQEQIDLNTKEYELSNADGIDPLPQDWSFKTSLDIQIRLHG